METIKMKNKKGKMVDRLILGQLEGEALEICKNPRKYFVFADRSTGQIYASFMGNRLSDEELKARNEQKLLKIEERIKRLNEKKAKLKG